MLLINFNTIAQSNEGNEFWFGFMEHVDSGNNTMVAMITSKTNTSGTISLPSIGFSKTWNVAAGDVTLITFPSQVENTGSESVTKKGIVVKSVDPVSVYIHQYANNRSEASLVLPVESIGEEYYVMCYTGFQRNSDNYYSQFLIVGIDENNFIEITPSTQTLRGAVAGNVISVNLRRGETYQVQAGSPSGDMTGTKIVSEGRIAVFAGAEWTQVPLGCTFMDNLMEQMYPVGTWGQKYVTAPSIKVTSDRYRVLASEDGTQVDVKTNTGIQTYMLNAGEFQEYVLPSVPSLVESTAPILLAHYDEGTNCSGYGLGDPSFLLINAIEQSRDTVTLYNSSFENIMENYVTAIIKTDDIQITTFDGIPIATQATETGMVGDNNEFSYFIMTVQQGSHTIISPGCGVIAAAYGYGTTESYSYGGGANFKDVRNNPLPEGGCLNDTVVFDAGFSPFRFDVEWDFGDGTKSTENIASNVYTELGTYSVVLNFTDKCLGVDGKLEKDIFITLRDMVEADDSISVCQYSELDLFATDLAGATYQWKGPNRYKTTDQFPRIDSISTLGNGTYEVIGIISGCATFPAYTQVEVRPAPIPVLAIDNIFCSRESTVFLTPGEFPAYNWSTGSKMEEIEISQEGIYGVTVTGENDCPGETEIELVDICPSEAYVPNIFSPNGDGINDAFTIVGYQVRTYKITIFDRWGNLVFRSTDIESPWDGRYNGRKAVSGVYIFNIEYTGQDKEGNEVSFQDHGTVTLVR